MRRAFTTTLVELAREHDDIVLLTGDLGYTVLEPFQEEFPDRFFNMGVAEQNMVGVATGLAEAGYRPFVYSIVTFATMRPYEFIRNGPIMHGLPVRIVGVGAGLDYAHDGVSHYGLEDVALMRMHPGMTVVAPADGRQTQAALAATWDAPGPVYYRLGKEEDLLVPGLDGRFRAGRGGGHRIRPRRGARRAGIQRRAGRRGRGAARASAAGRRGSWWWPRSARRRPTRWPGTSRRSRWP